MTGNLDSLKIRGKAAENMWAHAREIEQLLKLKIAELTGKEKK